MWIRNKSVMQRRMLPSATSVVHALLYQVLTAFNAAGFKWLNAQNKFVISLLPNSPF
jgi:hypothetical protein